MYEKGSVTTTHGGYRLMASKVDNYTVARLQMLIPNICDLVHKEHLKKCAQQFTEK